MKAGDTVFDGHKTLTVTKVGRVWATVEGGKAFRFAELRKGAALRWSVGSVRGSEIVYPSEAAMHAINEAKETERLLIRLWAEFSNQAQRWRPPVGLTVEKVRAAAEILGIKLSQKGGGKV